MSDWSSFQGDKKRMDDWRTFLTESKSPQKIEEIEWFGAKKRREKAALKTDRKLAAARRLQNVENWIDDDHKIFDDQGTKLLKKYRKEFLEGEHAAAWAQIMHQSDIDIDELLEWIHWRFEKGFSGEEIQKIEKLRTERDARPEEAEEETQKEFEENPENFKSPDLASLSQYEREEAEEEEEEEAEETEEEADEEAGATPWYTRYAEKVRGQAEKFKDRFKGDEEETEEGEEDTSPYNWKEKPWGISSKENGESLLNVFKDYGIDAEIANKVAALVTKLARNEDVVLEEVTLRGRTDEPQRIFYPASMKTRQKFLKGLTSDADILDNIKIALNKWGKYNTVKFAEVEDEEVPTDTGAATTVDEPRAQIVKVLPDGRVQIQRQGSDRAEIKAPEDLTDEERTILQQQDETQGLFKEHKIYQRWKLLSGIK